MKNLWKNLSQSTLLFVLILLTSMLYGIDVAPLELSGSPKSGKTLQSSEEFVLRSRTLSAVASAGKHVAATNVSVIDVVAPNEIKVTFFDDAVYSIIVEKETVGYQNSRVYSGKIKGEDFQTAVVVAGSDGSILLTLDNIFSGISYTVSSNKGNILIKEMDYHELSRQSRGESVAPPSIDTTSAPISAVTPRKTLNADVIPPPTSTKPTPFVDVMVVYDGSGLAWVTDTGKTTPELFAQSGVDKMNVALSNSGITEFTYRLTHVKQDSMGYTFDPNATTDAEKYFEFTRIISSMVLSMDTRFVHVRELRETYGADMVTCFVYQGRDTGTVGVGFSREADNASQFPSYAYNVVNAPNAIIGHTLTHEIGHNIGVGHSRTQAAQPGPQYWGGLNDYSAGYQVYDTQIAGAVPGQYDAYTIMAYNFDGATTQNRGNKFLVEVPRFSAPDTYTMTRDGKECSWTVGAANANNTRLLKEQWASAALFCPTKVFSNQLVSITNAPLQIDTPITLTANSSLGYTNFTCSISLGSEFATIDAQSGLLTPKGVGNVTVKVVEEGNEACYAGEATQIIQIVEPPRQNQVVTIVGPAVLGLGTPDQFTTSSPSGTPATWSIIAGAEYATLDSSTGYVTPKSAGSITLKAALPISFGYNATDTMKEITIVSNYPSSTEVEVTATTEGVTLVFPTLSTTLTTSTYSILRSDAKDGVYTQVETGFTGGTFLDNTAVPGKKYFYKLRAE